MKNQAAKTIYCTLLILSMLCVAQPAQDVAPKQYKMNWQKAAPVFGAAFVFSGVGWHFKNEIKPFTPEEIAGLNAASINPLDRPATGFWSPSAASASDFLRSTLLAAPLAMLLFPPAQKEWFTYGTMYLEALSIAGGIALLTKGVFRRTRPFAYNAEAPQKEKLTEYARESFVSGHAAIAFASAVFLGKTVSDFFPESPYKKWVWGVGILTAATVAGLRVASGNHFYTDVLAGGLLGAAAGYAVPVWHRQRGQRTTGLSFVFTLR
jgi:membrane-associated phospholipid phosphatase